MKRNLAVAGAVCLGFVAAAHATVTDLNISLNSGAGSLFFADGTFDEGTDWRWQSNPNGSATGFVYEDWVGAGPVTLGADVVYTGSDAIVKLYKFATNHSGFDWTDFHMTLTPSPTSTVSVDLATSNRFSDITVQANPDGSTDVWYLTDPGAGDTPILAGQSARLDLRVLVTGDGDFTIAQHPTPEPTSLALLALGGLAALRGRRRN